MNDLVIRLLGDASSFNRMLYAARQALHAFGNIVSSSVGIAAAAEMVELQLSVMLEGINRGKQMMQDLIVFTAETPLRLPETQEAARTLLQFGLAGDSIIPTLRLIGDVTGGDNERFTRMARALGRVSSHGRLMGRELISMIVNGFNPLLEISRTSGLSMIHLRDIMRKGAISYDMVRAAMVSATSEGGRFHNMMYRQSQTAAGLWSTMVDYIQMVMRQVGKDVIELFYLKEVMRIVIESARLLWRWLEAADPAMKLFGYAVAFGSAALLGMVYILPYIAALAMPFLSFLGAIASFTLTGPGIAVLGFTAALLTLSGVLVKTAGGIHAVMSAGRQIIGGILSVFRGEQAPREEDDAVGGGRVTEATMMGVRFAQNMIAAWKWISNAALTTWAYVSAYTQAFVDWASPYVFTALAYISWGWSWIADNAGTAWTIIKDAVISFVNWSMPIIAAWLGYINAVWGVVTAVAGLVWEGIVIAAGWALDFILQGWRALADNGVVTWTTIQDLLIAVFIAAEFGIRNFSSVWDWAIVGISYKFVQWKNLFINFFVATLPVLLTNMAANWGRVWNAVADMLLEVFNTFTMANLWGLVMGEIPLAQLQGRIANAFNQTMAVPIALAIPLPRVIPQDEALLRQEFQRAGRNLGESWDQFYDRRRREIGGFAFNLPEVNIDRNFALNNNEIARVGYEAGHLSEDSWQRGQRDAKAKFDAVAFYSAEAAARVRAYADMLSGSGGRDETNIQTNLLPPALPVVDVPGHSLYMIYDMPAVDLQLVLVEPTRSNVSDVMNEAEEMVGVTGEVTTELNTTESGILAALGATNVLLTEILLSLGGEQAGVEIAAANLDGFEVA